MDFEFMFGNSSEVGDQEWQFEGWTGEETIAPGESFDVTAEVNQDLEISVSVTPDAKQFRNAAGTLKYSWFAQMERQFCELLLSSADERRTKDDP